MDGDDPTRRMLSVLLTLVSISMLAAALAVRLPAEGTLWYFDTTKVFLPLATFLHDAVRSGGLPLWVEELGLGFPLAAEGQVGAFYPPNLLLHLLPPLEAMELSRIVHLAVAGVGAGAIVLRLAGSRLGGIVACLGAVLGGGIVAKLEWSNVVVAYAWLPWIILPLLRRPGPTARGLGLAGLAWGFQGLAGHPNTWLMTGIAAAVILVVVAPRGPGLLRVITFGAIAVGVAAIQLVPTLALWSLSGRTEGLPDWDVFSNSATALDFLLPAFANAFMPLGEREWDFAQQWYPGGLWGLREASAYLGLPLLALAGIGLTQRRARPLAVVAIVMVAIAVAGAFRPALWLETPILNGLRHPARAYMIAALMVSVIAGIGVGRLHRARPSWWPALVAVASPIVAYVAVAVAAAAAPDAFASFLSWAFGLASEDAGAARVRAMDVLWRPYPLLPELACAVAMLVLVDVRARGGMAAWGAPLATALVAVPLVLFSPTVNPTRPPAEISHAHGAYMTAVRDAAPSRFFALIEPSWYEGIPNQLAAAGIPELGMFASLEIHSIDVVADDIRYPEPDARLAAALGVDVLASFADATCPGPTVARLDGGVTLCRVPDALRPPYWLPSDAVGTASDNSTGTAASVHRLLGWRVLDRPVDVERALEAGAPVEVVSRTTHGLEIRLDAPDAGWVWIDRAWWPSWETRVDGEPVVPDRAWGGQLVPVPAGETVITQRFVPSDVLLGGAISLATVVVVSSWLGVERRLRRRVSSGSAD